MASIYQRGPAWVLTWREGGRQYRKSLGKVSAEEAAGALAALQQRLNGHAPAAGPAFDDWCVTYSAWHSQEYPASYWRIGQLMEQHLIPYFADRPLLGLRREDAEAYKHARLAAGAAAGTVTKELRTLQAIMNRAVFCEVIPRNPLSGVRPPKDLASAPPRWFTKDELDGLYATELAVPKCTSADDAELHRRYRWSWSLLANTGLRRAEALALRWRNVGTDELRVVSTAEARTKSGKWRLIPVSAAGRASLDELVGDRDWVLPRIRPESLSRAFDRTLTRAQLDGSIHCLRHTYCSHLVMRGVDLRTVQVLAGHASFTTTLKYAHLAPGHLRDAVRGLDL